MNAKLWPYKYEDTVKVTEIFDPIIGEPINSYTAEHHPGWNAATDYNESNTVSWIYVDPALAPSQEAFEEWVQETELELVEENVRFGE